MEKQEWKKRKERYAMFLTETGAFSCPYPWHEEVRLEEEKKAADLFLRMRRGRERSFLWEESADFSRSQYRTEVYQNIRTMALVWKRKKNGEGDPSFLSDVIEAIDWMGEHGYQKGMERTDNWWDWQIGVPLALLDCCFLLREELGEERIRKACETVEYFSGRQTLTNPIFTGANLVWTAMISAMCGILCEDMQEIAEAKQAAKKELHFVEEGDGFYRDGSFIQHGNLAYTGGYGISFLDQMSRMMVLLSGTQGAFTREEYGMICYFLEHSFFPVTVDGQVMDMVCGREISRHFMKGNQAGKTLMDSMWRMHLCVDQNTSDWLLERVDQWQNRQGRPSQFVFFDHMDRAVCRRETYSAGLALYSSRIQNYEAINEENKGGYHTGSGMLYLYPDGENDYEGCFWCTADMDFLPGTTVVAASRPSHLHVQKSSFVGGVGLGICGAAAMEVTEEAFHVKKSWFFFEDSIVCLGNDMTCQNGSLVTTVENRTFSRMDEKNGELWTEETEGKTRWLYTRREKEENGRGVLFLKPAGLDRMEERRSGTWTKINTCTPLDTVYTEEYLKIWIDHGKQGEHPDYAYVLYPVTKKEMLAGREQETQILAFDDQIHAVWQKRENRIAGVCWSSKGGQISFAGNGNETGTIHVHGPAVFMAEIRGSKMTIAAKNPLMPSNPVQLEAEGGGINYEIISGAPWGDRVEPDAKAPGADGHPAE